MDTGAVPELLILAPAHERGMSELWQAASANQFACPADQPFNPWIEAFLDEGVNFAFDDDHRLPTELPDDLTGVRCIVLERALQDELRSGERAEQLLAFEAAGGYVFSPPASALWTGAPAGVGQADSNGLGGWPLLTYRPIPDARFSETRIESPTRPTYYPPSEARQSAKLNKRSQ